MRISKSLEHSDISAICERRNGGETGRGNVHAVAVRPIKVFILVIIICFKAVFGDGMLSFLTSVALAHLFFRPTSKLGSYTVVYPCKQKKSPNHHWDLLSPQAFIFNHYKFLQTGKINQNPTTCVFEMCYKKSYYWKRCRVDSTRVKYHLRRVITAVGKGHRAA